ncbi:RNA-binding domain-containing protein [Thermoproteota archaeon]
MTNIKIKAKIQATEDPIKVIKAIKNIFGNIEITHDIEQNVLTGKEINEIKSLANFRSIIARDRIRTTLNNTFLRWMNEDYLSFGLNRQAAFAGHVSLNLTNEDPMGPIQVQIKGDVQDVISYLCS